MIATILITGGAGNAGSELANKLAEDSNNFIVVQKIKLVTQQL
jgi:short-subunit dehydrogenase involved in D-alanine esterification of teichoic acids